MTALAAFRADIDRIDAVSDWLASPPALRPEMLAAAKAIGCGCVVLLSGYFESFIRACMRGFILQVNGLGKPLAIMPRSMRYTHFQQGARALEKQIRRDKKSGNTTQSEDLANRLASFGSVSGYQFAWEAFAETHANPGPNVIGELLSKVGVKSAWARLKGVTTPGRGDLELFLTSFIEIRNDCAHTGGASSNPTASDLREYGDNLDALAAAMVKVLQNRIAELAAL